MSENPDPKWVYPNLREQRFAIGWTQQDLSQESKTSVSTVQRVEKGIPVVRRTIVKIFNAMKSELQDLVEEEELTAID